MVDEARIAAGVEQHASNAVHGDTQSLIALHSELKSLSREDLNLVAERVQQDMQAASGRFYSKVSLNRDREGNVMSLEFSPSLHERARSKWNGGETHSVQVTFTPVNNVNASHDMLERATKSFRDLPPEVRQLLLKHSVSFVTTDTMPDAAKNFWGPWFVQSFRIQLRGYPEGATWENNSGYTSGSTVYMSERLRDLASGQMYKDGGVESTVRHESGHEVDKLLCEISKCSDSSEFKTAYANDLARIPDSDKPELQYFLQRAGGRSETFAEVFAAIVGGGAASERESELIAKYFSETRAYVQTKIDGLK